MSTILAATAAVSKAIAIAQAATEAAKFASMAIEAANSGDEAQAAEFLRQSRDSYAMARQAWDSA